MFVFFFSMYFFLYKIYIFFGYFSIFTDFFFFLILLPSVRGEKTKWESGKEEEVGGERERERKGFFSTSSTHHAAPQMEDAPSFLPTCFLFIYLFIYKN